MTLSIKFNLLNLGSKALHDLVPANHSNLLPLFPLSLLKLHQTYSNLKISVPPVPSTWNVLPPDTFKWLAASRHSDLS